jgi:hypothetical protein
MSSLCFSGCKSLLSITFESNSQLQYIEFHAFLDLSHTATIPVLLRLSFSDPDSYHVFARWRNLRQSGINVDFQRIPRSDASFQCFKDSLLEMSLFTEGSVLVEGDRVVTQFQKRRIDGALTVVKTFSCQYQSSVVKLKERSRIR